MTLNGWQRLWVCLTVAWTVVFALGAYAWWESWFQLREHGYSNDPLATALLGTAVTWMIPPVLMYASGWAVGWIRRGFSGGRP